MVLFSPLSNEVEMLFDTWFETLPSEIAENIKIMKKLKELKEIFVIPILN